MPACLELRIYLGRKDEGRITNRRLRVTKETSALRYSGHHLPRVLSDRCFSCARSSSPGHLQSHEVTDTHSILYMRKSGLSKFEYPAHGHTEGPGFRPVLCEAKAHSLYKDYSETLN